MVNWWWIAGEGWLVDGHFSSSKNFTLSGFIFQGFPFWEYSATHQYGGTKKGGPKASPTPTNQPKTY
jgi:hypothetical protein